MKNFLWLCMVGLMSCQVGQPKHIGRPVFDFNHPKEILILPEELHEVSGISISSQHQLQCVQDEMGIIYTYDFDSKALQSQVVFDEPGDFEGIACVDSITTYVLRSDGVLYRVIQLNQDSLSIQSFDTGIPSGNNEGLCYDPLHARLLIAAKGKSGKGKEWKDIRLVHAFSILSTSMDSLPAFTFRMEEVKDFALDHQLEVPMKERGKRGPEPWIKYQTSAIGIHPITSELYVLSAKDCLLLKYNNEGLLQDVILLDPEIYNKAEGIAFLPNGDMLISNEGQDGKPTCIVIPWMERR